MSRRAFLVLCTAAVAHVPADPLGAQASAPAGARAPDAPPAAPAQASPPAIPGTPAGAVLRAWLDAFNSADTARMGAYYRRHQPDLTAASELPFREQTGGFALLTVERSAPRHVEFVVRERTSATTAYGAIDVSDADPPRVTAFALQALGPNVAAADLRLDAAARARAVAGVAAKLDSFYVSPDVARRMGDSLRARRARGAYDAEPNGMALALRLGAELGVLSRDKHLRVGFSVRPLPPEPAADPAADSALRPTRPPEELARERARMDGITCGFVKAERLAGNVGYLKFDLFADPDVCGPTASAAMTFLAGTRALVVDLRDNGGGDPAMVAYLASYLFDRRTHLNDLYTRVTGTTEAFWTRDSVPGRRFGGEKPVVVLTSARTFSGAEEFAYDLQALKRATVVGETTGGGAHPVRGRRIDEHFVVMLPWRRAVNPVTKTNWEGVGVTPDVKTSTDAALMVAQRQIEQRLSTRAQP